MEPKYEFMFHSGLFAMAGGLVSFLLDDKHSSFAFVVALIVSGFVGVMAGQLCHYFEVDDDLIYFILGSCGVTAKLLVTVIRKETIKRAERLMK